MVVTAKGAVIKKKTNKPQDEVATKLRSDREGAGAVVGVRQCREENFRK